MNIDLALLDRVSFKGDPRIVIGVRLVDRGCSGEYNPVYLTANEADLSDLGDGKWRAASCYEAAIDGTGLDE